MANTREKLAQVEIYGQRYTLKGSEDSAYVESLAAHVDKRMRELADTSSTVDSLKVAVLAAVNIAVVNIAAVNPRPLVPAAREARRGGQGSRRPVRPVPAESGDDRRSDPQLPQSSGSRQPESRQ